MAAPPLISLGSAHALENLERTIRHKIARQRRSRLWCRYKHPGSARVSAIDSSGAWELPHEFRQMQDTARRFMRERVRPAEAPLPHDAYALPDEVLRPLQQEAKRLGFWHVESPSEWGGAGLNLLGQAVVAEESSQCKMGLYIPACHAFGYDPPNSIFLGREDQIENYAVPAIRNGDKTLLRISEASGGSDPGRPIQTRAQKRGDPYSLNGTK